MENRINISFWDFIKLITQIAVVITFIITMQQNQEHINKDLDAIKVKVNNIDKINERLIILETRFVDQIDNNNGKHLLSGRDRR